MFAVSVDLAKLGEEKGCHIRSGGERIVTFRGEEPAIYQTILSLLVTFRPLWP